MRAIAFAATLLAAALILSAQDLKEFEKKVTEFTLPNGLHFLIVERHEALRTTFEVVDGQPVQHIAPVVESSFALIEQDLRGHKDEARQLERSLARWSMLGW